ncbi:MAG TPA: addiction module protein [Bacteroidetes bacterium]|nr:addiction module protein [Bacteroidota bacterium]
MRAQNFIDVDLIERINKLSVSERILIVEQIWDSIALSKERLPISDEQKEDLEKRINDYQRNPMDGVSWAVVKEKIESNL